MDLPAWPMTIIPGIVSMDKLEKIVFPTTALALFDSMMFCITFPVLIFTLPLFSLTYIITGTFKTRTNIFNWCREEEKC